jgi:hypothetical protein
MKRTLDPLLADPFEVHRQIFLDKQNWQRVCAAQTLLLAILVVGLCMLAQRPPMVVVKDRVHGEPAVVRDALDSPPISVADARNFFINMLRLRFAWSSLTVERDLQQYLDQCYGEQRDAEAEHFSEASPTLPGQPGEAASRVQAWVDAEIDNRLLLPDSLEAIVCSRKQAIWHCNLQGTILTQRLQPPLQVPPPQLRLDFVGSFLEVPHTVGTPYGLVVGALRQLPVTVAQLPPPEASK